MSMDRLGIFSGALLLGLTLSRVVETPTRPLALEALGSPVAVNLSATTLMLLLLAALSATATEAFLRGHPYIVRNPFEGTLIYWIVPVLLVVAAGGFLAGVPSTGGWFVGLAFIAVGIPLALAAEYYSVDPESRGRAWVHWGESVLIHAIALMFYILIYGLSVRALLSGPAVVIVTTLLMGRLFYFQMPRPTKAFFYGVTGGILAGLLAWALNYAPLSTAQGSFTLLLFFYVFAGLIHRYLLGRFGRRVVLEYALVTFLGLAVITFL